MSERSQGQVSYQFLSHADMWPSQINAGYQGAQFVARAHVPAREVPVAAYFSRSVTDDVWGLLISAEHAGPMDRMVTVTTDDGREFSAGIATGELLAGDPQSVLATARYWELPPRYIAQLKSALQDGGMPVEDEEPRDDGSLG